LRYAVFDTAAGICAVAWGPAGIVRFQLPLREPAAVERAIRRRVPAAAPGEPDPALVAAVRGYFDGARVEFDGFAVDPGPQEPFAARIHAAVRALRWGETTSYGALARALGGGPEAAREVGAAMARNPVPLIVPCHRVLAAGGRIGGFSAPGGAATKRRMLALEGAAVEGGQQSFAF
jgi:methylated-DNA-[protein]-cysteine S-methyltransferase